MRMPRTGLLAALLLLAPVADAQSPPFDLSSLATGPFSGARMRLEKTFLDVDVATLEVRFGEGTQARLRSLAAGRGATKAVRDAVARAATDSDDAYVRLRFLRGFDFDRMKAETRKTVRCAWKAGYIERDDFELVVANFPTLFAFLARRGVRAGDALLYRIEGERLRTVYRTAKGQVLLDVAAEGAGPRRTMLASYFAPCSDFHRPLLDALLSRP